MMFLVPLIFGVVLLFVFLGRQGAAAQGATHAAHVAAVAASHATRRRPAPRRPLTRPRRRRCRRPARPAPAARRDGHAPTAGNPAAWSPSPCRARSNASDLGAIDAPARTLRGSSRAVLDEYRGFGP